MWQYFWPHISLIYRNLTGGKTHVSHPVIFISRYGYVIVISVLYWVRVMEFNATLNQINNQNIDNSECLGVKFVKIYLEMTFLLKYGFG
jgi:hypothetical protein